MKRLFKIFGMHVNFMQCAWWLHWEKVFLKHHMHRAFNWCSHKFRMANYELSSRLYERATENW